MLQRPLDVTHTVASWS